MFNWLTSWWGPDSVTGVARNAPNGGINIKLFFEQKPTQVIIVTSEEIVTIRNGLRKTEINAIPPISNKNPIMKEFDDVFSEGYQQFFQKRKQQRANIEIIISDHQDTEIFETKNESENKSENKNEDKNEEENESEDKSEDKSKDEIVVE